jgi:hypothetical protein
MKTHGDAIRFALDRYRKGLDNLPEEYVSRENYLDINGLGLGLCFFFSWNYVTVSDEFKKEYSKSMALLCSVPTMETYEDAKSLLYARIIRLEEVLPKWDLIELP